jgi:hypothetical protein
VHHLLHEPRSSRHAPLRQLISSFIAAADWTLLCNRLLPLLQEQQLLTLARLVAQQQQQQAIRHDHNHMDSVWHWLSEQATYNATAANTAGAAAAASQLPCVQNLRELVLCSSAQQWTLEQLLLANALTCRRQQLLSLLHQEDETEQLLQLVNAAAQLFAKQPPLPHAQPAAADGAGASREGQGPAAAAAAAAAAAGRVQQVVKAVLETAESWPDQQLQLLLVGWLLRLQLLLAAAGGPAEADRVLRGLGCSCRSAQEQQQQQQLVAGSPAQQQQKQQQQRHASGELGEAVTAPEQMEQPARKPLRRGNTAAAAAAAVEDGHGAPKLRSRQGIKEKSSKQKRKKRKKHSRKDNSSSSPEDDRDGPTRVKHAHKRRKHNRKQHRNKKKRRHVHTSSSESDSSASSSSSMDLDAGGELLDPAAFPPWKTSAAAAAGGEGDGAVAAAARAALHIAAVGDSAAAAAAGADEKQQQLAVVLEALSSRKAEQWRPWVVQLPTSKLVAAAAAAAAAAGSGGAGAAAAAPAAAGGVGSSSGASAASCVAVQGTAAEVMDAAACYCTWQLMAAAAVPK